MQSLVRVTDAATEPVTLAEAQAFLRVDSADDDALITSLITTARQFVEEFTGRALISQSWKLVRSEWPDGAGTIASMIDLDRSPLIAVQSLKYYPASGAAQATQSAATYYVLTGPTPGCVYLASAESWPSIADRPDAVEVNFTSGYADAAAVPRTLRHCVLFMLSHLYENRAAVNIGNIVNELPFALKHLLESQRVGGWIS